MNSQIETISTLKSEWDARQPLPQENEHRLWQKLRLEWNYNSNHIEGNTLTYGETELLLVHGQTHGNHTLREYEEMRAHDVGITHLRELAEDETRVLGEIDIRNLNKIILKEPFWKPAQTVDGQSTRKQIIPGEYKNTPNNVLTATGELFEFAAPSDVPSKMQELVKWLEEFMGGFRDAELLWLLAKLHHDFVLIHPFDDGNGRVARMLVNYVLMRLDYPPIIVPTERKKDYLAALRLADAGDIAELQKFLGTCVVRSLELGVKAAKGESLDEPGDIEKEIALFVRSQEPHREKVQPKSQAAIKALYENGLKELIERSLEKMKIFDALFLKSNIVVDPQKPAGSNDPLLNFTTQMADGFKSPKHFHLTFNFADYRGEAKSRFSTNTTLQMNFEASDYTVSIGNQVIARKLYTEPLLSEERDQAIERLLKVVFDDIKNKSGKK